MEYSMFSVVMIVSLCFLFLGSVGFALLNRKSDGNKSRERNVKLLVYVVLVFTLYFSMQFSSPVLYVIASALVIIALREILNAASLSGKSPFPALAIALPVFYFFAQFIKDAPVSLQLLTYFVVVHFDGFSQVAGETFGKHKMFPSISPAKTWEGLAGGIIVSVVISVPVYLYSNLGRNWLEVLLLNVIIIGAAFAGDMLASWYKRITGIKDFSTLLPGHGGILDRFDSFFMAGATIQLLQNIYAP